MYVTLVQLAESPGALELSQVASDAHAAPVDPALMEATLRGEDRSAWPAEAIAAADDAAQRITTIVGETDELIDAYLARRVTIPRDPVPGILVSIARAVVRYELHKHLIASESTHPIVRDYRDRLRLLEAIRDGKVTLGAEDPGAADNVTANDVRFDGDERVFTRRGMRRFP